MIIDHISCKQKQLRAIQQHGESFNKRFACVMKKKKWDLQPHIVHVIERRELDKIMKRFIGVVA